MAHNNHRQRQPGLARPVPYQGPSPAPLVCPPGSDYLMELFGFLEPVEAMKKNGYVMEPLTDAELKEKARCQDCNQTIASLTKDLPRKLQQRLENPTPPPPKKAWDPLPTMLVHVGNGKFETKQCALLCKFHPGTVDRATKHFTCCDTHVSESQPCITNTQHSIRAHAPGELAQIYQFRTTPAPAGPKRASIRVAVALDCEMGTAITGDSELIRLTAIDYLTGEVLINNLVQPDQPMLHLNTRYSGVTWKQLDNARRSRTCLLGKAGAREALWRFVGPQTALVGHGVSNDLRALRWIHGAVVDSYLVELKVVQAKKAAAAAAEKAAAASLETGDKEAEKKTGDAAEPLPKKKKVKGSGDLALKTLMKKYLGREIQMQGNRGHDSFEDALAARDLVHWMVMQRLMEKKGLTVAA